MNAGYSKSSGPDWCSVFRPPTQTTWATIDAEKATESKEQSNEQSQQSQKSQRKDRVKIIVNKDMKYPKTQ
jgi:hypothetical protein